MKNRERLTSIFNSFDAPKIGKKSSEHFRKTLLLNSDVVTSSSGLQSLSMALFYIKNLYVLIDKYIICYNHPSVQG